MFLPPFEGPRLLVNRSRQLTACLQEYLEGVASRMTIRFDSTREERCTKHVLRLSEAMDVEQFPVFRDAVNNLAVCLDITICDLARIAGKPIDQVKYPFAKNEKTYRGIVKQIGLGPIFEEWLQRTHPGFGQNPWLAQLHALDVLMKHRVVMPLLAKVGGQPLSRIPFPKEVAEGMRELWGIDPATATVKYTDGMVLRLGDDNADPYEEAAFNGILEMVLPRGVPFGGEDVVPLLKGLDNAISGFIVDVEALSERIR